MIALPPLPPLPIHVRWPAAAAPCQVQSISSLVLEEYTDVLEHHLNVAACVPKNKAMPCPCG